MKRRAREFNELSQVPAQPRRVLSGQWETPHEVHARTGLPLKPLCEQLISWFNAGFIMHAEIRTPTCTVPVFKEKTLFETGKKVTDLHVSE